MIAYIPSSQASALTAALWELSDPNPTRGTTGLFPVEAALDKSTWLRVPTDFSIPVRKDATIGETIPKILQPWIDDGLLPRGTLTQLSDHIVSRRGKRLVVYEAFPPIFKLKDESNPNGLGRTRAQMIEEGRLAQSSMENIPAASSL